MVVTPEASRPKDYREHALDRYIEDEVETTGEDSHTRSLRELTDFFSNEVIPIIDNEELANRILKLRKAPPIKERAVMKPIIEVSDISDDLDGNNGNNFIPNFIFKEKDIERSDMTMETLQGLLSGEINPHDIELPVAADEEGYPEPVTAEELQLWSKGNLGFNRTGNHSLRPAFKRMYALFPEFTTDLVVRANRLTRSQWHLVEAKAYVAYNIMAQLVDKDDEGVSKDGITDPNYLTS